MSDTKPPVIGDPGSRDFILTLGNEQIPVQIAELRRLATSPINVFDQIAANASTAARIELTSLSIPFLSGQDVIDNFPLVQGIIQGRSYRGHNGSNWTNDGVRVTRSRDELIFAWRNELIPISVWEFHRKSENGNVDRIIRNIAYSIGIEGLSFSTDPQVATAFNFIKARTYKR